jgi:hypothetical protein
MQATIDLSVVFSDHMNCDLRVMCGPRYNSFGRRSRGGRRRGSSLSDRPGGRYPSRLWMTRRIGGMGWSDGDQTRSIESGSIRYSGHRMNRSARIILWWVMGIAFMAGLAFGRSGMSILEAIPLSTLSSPANSATISAALDARTLSGIRRVRLAEALVTISIALLALLYIDERRRRRIEPRGFPLD